MGGFGSSLSLDKLVRRGPARTTRGLEGCSLSFVGGGGGRVSAGDEVGWGKCLKLTH